MSLLGWALVLAAACTRGESAETEAPRGMVAELARAVGPAPTLGPRLSIAREPSECASEAGCRETGTPSRRVNTVAARASQAARASVAPDALHASALVDLLWADDEGTSLRRSIQYLQTAARLDPRPAPILADLSAAHLVRAERANSPRDLLEAVENAERALQKDPANRAALFNRALGLERFGLMGEAGRSWRAYLAADSTSNWADAARKRLAEVSRVPVLPKAPSANATGAELAAYAVADPQGARTMGWDHLLGEWGAAVLAGDAAKAADRLHRAEVLGNALERAGRDATLADAVRAIRAQVANVPAVRRLASAHRSFSGGREAYQRPHYESAAPLFAAAQRDARLSPALTAWAGAFAGAARVLSGDADRGEPLVREVARSVDAQRHPALAGRVQWFLAATLLRTDQYEPALTHAEAGAKDLGRAGEREYSGAVIGIAAAAAFELGDPERGYEAARLALERLRPYPASLPLHNLLFSLAETAAADGYTRTALRVQSEGVQVAVGTGRDLYVIEARLARARILGIVGEYGPAEHDIEAARGLVRRIDIPNARAWFEADLRLADAAITLRTQPERAAIALDSAIQFFDAFDAPVRVLPAIVGRARAKLALNDVEGATADLDSAVARLDTRRSAIANPTLRASLMDAAKGVFDEVVILLLGTGRNTEALALLDRSRASSTRRGDGVTRVQSPPGEVALSYALLGDELVIWLVNGRDVTFSKARVDTAEFFSTIRQVRSKLELSRDDAGLQVGLSRLYDWLIRPVEGQISRAESQLVLITDGEVGTVPFAALRNEQTARYLVEDHTIRFASSLREAARPLAVQRSAGTVIVADPRFNPEANPGFEPLADAAAEAAEVGRRYPGAEVLFGSQATPAAVAAAISDATVVHYAGHAVFDHNRPENSFLLLAPEPGAPAVDRLTATAITQMNLTGVRLVFLAACQSVRSGNGRAGGLAGLAGSLLSAGAGGVVGSLWRVEDRDARVLTSGFHDRYRRSGDAARSLRSAQLAMLRSGSLSYQSPAAWAGFRYVGGYALTSTRKKT